MGFQNLNIKIRYRSDDSDVVNDFLIPVLSQTKLYKRSVGFFSTSSLLDLSTGLFAMAENGGKVQLVCSPRLSEEDIESIDKGYKTRDEVFEGALSVSMTSPVTYYEEERLNLVATMIASGMLEVRLAFMETENGVALYHEKMAVFIDELGDKIAYTGSMNESNNAFNDNFESIYTFCSWKDESQKNAVVIEENDFEKMWDDHTKKLRIIPFPQVIIEKLMQYKKDTVDYTVDKKEYTVQSFIKEESAFHQPDYIKLRPYQNDAIAAWFAQECQGIFSMCTGAGKTFTALAAMVKLADKLDDNLAVFIVCPYIHLVSQWEEDVCEWGLLPIVAHSKSTTPQWEIKLKKSCRRFHKEGKPFICLTTNDTFSSEKIQKLVLGFTTNENVLIIVDEAHNFGSESLSKVLPEQCKYRIALSATIKRHMDKSGTAKLFNYFGEECIAYDLEQAIIDKALVPYEYYPIPVYLEPDELDKYKALTKELLKYRICVNGKIKIAESGKFVLFQRTRLLAGARAKTRLLLQLMEPYKNKKNILVYCGATKVEDDNSGVEERQIDLVTEKLRSELGMTAQRFTAEEGLGERQRIKTYFKDGLIQVITSIKCLDEGVNIPGIETAFILSSSRNQKEFIQRRGRLLRKSEGKQKAVIYDFVTLPRNLNDATSADYDADKGILIGEMARISEFGRLAKNRMQADKLISTIMDVYDRYIDIDEEIKLQEEYYDNGD